MIVRIREAQEQDRAQIRDLHMQAFPEQENRLTAALADRLLIEASVPATMTLVAVMNGEIVGHIAFSPVYRVGRSACLGCILAPLAVSPACHGKGVGSKLVTSGIALLSERGIEQLFVYGDPKYYGKFGFTAEAASGFVPPYELKYPFGWLAIPVSQRVIGGEPVDLVCAEALHNPELW